MNIWVCGYVCAFFEVCVNCIVYCICEVCTYVCMCVNVRCVHMREKEQKKKRKWRNLNFEKIADLAGIFGREICLAPKCSQYLGS